MADDFSTLGLLVKNADPGIDWSVSVVQQQPNMHCIRVRFLALPSFSIQFDLLFVRLQKYFVYTFNS